jgi:hypothetical protein
VTRPRTAWLAFALLGALATVVLLEFPIAGLVLLILALGGIALRPPRGAALTGLILGMGATWTLLMVRVKVSCEAFNAVAGQGCEAPGIGGWILVGLGMLAVGVLATIAVVASGRRGSRA